MIGALPEPGLARVFKRPEHEFLRIAARVTPRWETLRSLGQLPGFDWPYLRITALAHQLDGVVAWRLLDERMDGYAPNIVRDDCQRYLDWLDSTRFTWLDRAARLSEVIAGFGQPWYYWGFPTSYLLYGMHPGQWPRLGAGMEFHLWNVEPARVAERVSEFGTVQIARGAGQGVLITADGAETWLLCYPPKWIHPDDLNEDAFLSGVRETNVYGLSLPLLSAEAAMMMRGQQIVYALASGAPVSLQEVAHIANLARFADLDTLADLLRGLFTRHDAILSYLKEHPDDEVSVWPATTALAQILWAFEYADRCYGCFPGGWLDTMRRETISNSGLVLLATVGAVTESAATRFVPVRLAHGTDEAFLFEEYGTTGMQARLDAGLWQQAGKIAEAFRLDAIGRQVPEKAQDA